MIRVGAATETEMKEKKDRVDDALNATRAAVEEGITSGGGVALLRAQQVIEQWIENAKKATRSTDEIMGAQIVHRAIEEPLRIIVSNAGYEASVIVNQVKRESKATGFDAKSGKYVNMIDSGIVDPVKVTRSALQNAASIAGLLITTEAMVCDIPEEKKEPAGHGHGGPGMGMGGMGGMY